jgi:hypothetical protein
MRSKLFTTVGALILGAGILVATTQGCGGSSGTSADGAAGSGGVTITDVVNTCNKLCDKEATCVPELPAAVCKSSICSKIAASGAGGSTGSSGTASSCGGITYAEFQAKLNNCLSMECKPFQSCFMNICPSSTGGAGTGGGAAGTGGGTAGTTGAAGTGGGTTCAVCTKADACCGAIQGSSAGCSLKSSCDAAGAQASSIITACNSYVANASTIAAAMGMATVPDACK